VEVGVVCSAHVGQAAGIGVVVWDVTSDIGLPAFRCAIVEREVDPFRRVGVARGSGCHPDRAIALCRALTEAAQSRLTRITGSRDDLQSEELDQLRNLNEVRRHQQLLSSEGVVSFQQVEGRTVPTFEQDLDWTMARLEAVGLADVVFVDLSRSELPVSVVRVLIPGLEGDSTVPGYVPGQRATAVRDEGIRGGSKPIRDEGKP
jgi:ribosomal protein S12 methylthiotransferase accessory factor